MTSTIDRPALRVPQVGTRPVPPVDVHRLDEIARKLWWLAQIGDVTITAPAELDPCADCPEPLHPDEPGPAPSDAVIVYRTDALRWTYRDAVCADCLTAAVRDRAARAERSVVDVEIPAVVTA